MLCIHCHVQFASTLRSRAAAEEGEQRGVVTLWGNKSMRDGDISITKSILNIAQRLEHWVSLLLQQNDRMLLAKLKALGTPC